MRLRGGREQEGGERRRKRRKSEEKKTEAQAQSKAKPESRHSHKGAGGIYAESETESEERRRENDERKVCTRRGPLPEVKRENDRRNTPKRVSTAAHSPLCTACLSVPLQVGDDRGAKLEECAQRAVRTNLSLRALPRALHYIHYWCLMLLWSNALTVLVVEEEGFFLFFKGPHLGVD